jgi:hypothetical protein
MEQAGMNSTSAHDAPDSAPADMTRRRTDTRPRHDIYLFIHKGLRSFMGEVLAAVGRLDSEDASETARVLAQVRGLLDMCRSHLNKENEYVHPAMEARRPGSCARTAQDHAGHERAFDGIEAGIRTVESAAGAARATAVAKLYRQLAVFVAENFAHMEVEEAENNAVLWATHTDAELMAIEQAIVASIAPEQKAVMLRWMAPSLTPCERARLFTGLKRGAPEEVFAGMLALVKPHLDNRDWSKLMAALSG